ncbi:Uncharacterised protein [Candidatus Bilamarchaeum dharawalense]|uniref:DUF3566 domain-containing protein n=1 Tax=Candidatus Bilamarchaeum dharawalense TaxID=2885759 RepID=A0A5E4LMY4_9ARCH|nr:Uncharacterised protein [Candidatus Bilamarchaeum dharawalense]
MKVTLTHIGAISLGRLLAIWSFVLGLIGLCIYGVISILLAILGIAAGVDLVQTLIGVAIVLVMGVVGLFVGAIVMFIVGFITATVYNIILGVGGGIDMDFNERK